MPIYMFHTKQGPRSMSFQTAEEAIESAKKGGVERVGFAPTGKIIWEASAPSLEPQYAHYGTPFAYQVGHHVRKSKGYQFDGEVRAAFTTKAGEIRYAVQLITEPPGGNGDSMLHIFNESQLERA